MSIRHSKMVVLSECLLLVLCCIVQHWEISETASVF